MALDAKTTRAVRRLTQTVRALETQVHDMARASQARDRSWEAGQVQLVDADGVVRGLIGEQPDGTFATVAVNGPPPPIPSTPLVDTTHPGVMTVTWDGMTADGTSWPADLDRVRVHVDTLPGILPTDENEITAWHSTTGGTATLALDQGTTYVVLTAVSTSGTESLPSVEVSSDVASAVNADVAPTVSPLPTVVGGVDVLRVTWSELSPPVEVHVSTDATFTPVMGDPATLVTNADTAVTLARLPSGAPFSYSVVYYVRLIAYNGAGAAPPSDVASGSPAPGNLQLNQGGVTSTTRLIVTSTTDVNLLAGNEPPVRIGDINGNHLRVDGNEVMSMRDPSTKGNILIQGKSFTSWNFDDTDRTFGSDGETTVTHYLGGVPTVIFAQANQVGIDLVPHARTATTFGIHAKVSATGAVFTGTLTVFWLAIMS